MALFHKKNKLDLPKPNYPKPEPSFQKSELRLPKFPEPDFSETFQTYKPIIPKHDIEHIKEAVKPKIELINDDLGENPLNTFKEKKIIPSPAYEPLTSEENPLFVNIETFEEAIKDVEVIKDDITKINEVLNNLDAIKKQEDREIENWKHRVSQIKQKITTIDKNLFEKR
ncbi:MAG: hypothetical protein KJ674_02160 [Nanoarchaeota archaeon]|nr:hypothetical protein [Nanoarchaeota archaeon]